MNKNAFWLMVSYLVPAAFLVASCSPIVTKEEEMVTEEEALTLPTQRNYRQDMRNFVQSISAYAKSIEANFIIIPQNGHDLMIEDGDEAASPSIVYLDAIDGVGRESLFYGYDGDNEATPIAERDSMVAFMDFAEKNEVEVLVTDYCSTGSFVDDSFSQNAARGYISFAANRRNLDRIPVYPVNPFNMNSANIMSLSEANNFLYLLDPGSYAHKTDFLNALRNTNYDILIIDAFHNDNILTADDIATLKTKRNGGNRLHEYRRSRRVPILLAERMEP